MGSAASTDASPKWNDNRTKMSDKSKYRVIKVSHNCAAQNIGSGNSVVIANIPGPSFILGSAMTLDVVEGANIGLAVGIAEDGATLIANSNTHASSHYQTKQIGPHRGQEHRYDSQWFRHVGGTLNSLLSR